MQRVRNAGAATRAAVATGVGHATWALTGVLVALVSANVFARYVLAIGWPWVEELSRLLFVWVVFLGAYVALHRQQHMAIEFITRRLGTGARRHVLRFTHGAILLFLGIVVWSGASLVATTHELGRVTPILGISAAWSYLAVPVAGLLMLLDVLLPRPAETGADTGAEHVA